MKIYDITVPISENVPIYEGDPRVKIDVSSSIAKGDAANVTQLCFGAHTGTHVDAPNHFIDGTRKVHELDLEKLIGACRVIELDESVTAIEPRHVEIPETVERVLFKTRNSAFWNEPETGFRKDFTYISPEAARVLADKNGQARRHRLSFGRKIRLAGFCDAHHAFGKGNRHHRRLGFARSSGGRLRIDLPAAENHQPDRRRRTGANDFARKAADFAMNEKYLIKVSKYLSKHLRHQPERLGLTLEDGGWVKVDDLLKACADE